MARTPASRSALQHQLEPRLHGLHNLEAPSVVAVLVVNGNLPPSSSWSRRKPPKNPSTP